MLVFPSDPSADVHSCCDAVHSFPAGLCGGLVDGPVPVACWRSSHRGVKRPRWCCRDALRRRAMRYTLLSHLVGSWHSTWVPITFASPFGERCFCQHFGLGVVTPTAVMILSVSFRAFLLLSLLFLTPFIQLFISCFYLHRYIHVNPFLVEEGWSKAGQGDIRSGMVLFLLRRESDIMNGCRMGMAENADRTGR